MTFIGEPWPIILHLILLAISVKKKKDFRIIMISANEVGHYFSFFKKQFLISLQTSF